MKNIRYHIYATPFYAFVFVPFWLLYLISDFFFVVIYYIIGYRKHVVLTNLRNSFPKKTDEELETIMRKFYIHFCDMFLETIKSLTMSRTHLKMRYPIDDDSLKLAHQLHAKNQSVIIVMGHFGQWEVGGQSFSVESPFQLFAIYHPLKNKFFDWLFNYIRTHVGTKMISMSNTIREMIKNKDIVGGYTFIADQTPSNSKEAYWTTFLNQDTPVLWGTEKLAKKFDYPVVFASVRKIKRGYYKVFLEMLCENPKNTDDGYITALHTKKLEQEIINQPEIWLWSHRRWKHTRAKINQAFQI